MKGLNEAIYYCKAAGDHEGALLAYAMQQLFLYGPESRFFLGSDWPSIRSSIQCME
jgi:hypothetical protein